MCYSAMVVQSMKTIARQLQATPDLAAFEDVFRQRLTDKAIKITKAMEANFVDPSSPEEKRIKALIDQFNGLQETYLEQVLFTQKKRQVEADRALEVKLNKKASQDLRISTDKIARYQAKLQAMKSKVLKPNDSRIFPMVYAPVVVVENGKRLIRPMRYHCRQNGKPEWTDKKFDGLYNARRDSLGKYWKPLFGKHHGVMITTSFFENVALHDFERRKLREGEKPQNVVLHFNPQESDPMLVACLWDRWQKPGEPDLLSFAAITDEPPEEVAATGHDRCIVPLKPENLQQWLNPENSEIAALDGLLEDRQRPYYEHRLAA